jgi:site-specific DNA-methyltransferase (adenine-specific)
MIIRNNIFKGHAIEVLKQFPDACIDMVMTSPPYWGLRNYETEGVIWGGKKDCEHEWNEQTLKINRMQGLNEREQNESYNENSKFVGTEFHELKENKSAFCKKCGAWKGELGGEPSFELYIEHLCDIFDEVNRVLKDTGTCWVNMGDSYGGSGMGTTKYADTTKYVENSKQSYVLPNNSSVLSKYRGTNLDKCLLMIPSRFAIEMINRGWTLRNTLIWHKDNAMPSPIKDRFTVDFEYVFFFSKNKKYYFETQREPHKEDSVRRACRGRSSDKLDAGQYSTSYKEDYKGYEDIKGKLERGELRGVHPDGRNMRTTWTINTKPNSEEHYACVDVETECLTISGWKKYYELKKGMIIASFDLLNNQLQWERLEDLFIYDYNDDLIEITNPTINFCFTPNHRMICKNWNGKRKKWSNFYIKNADKITSHDRFPVSSNWENGSFGLSENEPTHDMCELLGWICAEGYYRDYSINIYQSLTANKEKCERIEYLLKNEKIKFSKHISEKKSGNYKGSKCVCFGIAWSRAMNIFSIIPNKKPTYNMLLWSKEGIQRFIDGFIDGDGHRRKDGRIIITQKDEITIDIIMILCFRLGYSVIKSSKKEYNKNPSCFALYLTNRKLCSARSSSNSRLNVIRKKYIGKVWCPKTKQGTFVARRHGRILITGNSYPIELCEIPIRAGCPEFICKKCGKIREKIYTKQEIVMEGKDATGKYQQSLVNSAGGREHYISEQRKFKPDQKEIAEFIKKYVGEYAEALDVDFGEHTWRHWIRTDDAGASLPSPEQYMKLKSLLGMPDDYDGVMLTTVKVMVDDSGDKRVFEGYSDCGCLAGFEPGVVLDPFFGTGTTGLTAKQLGRDFVGIDVSDKYIDIAKRRLRNWLNQKSLFEF